jgi:phosphopantothenate-cysteine ligase/phosphopantothenoylcysteine decarboxylase/phosphopantothenate--cysteine ligase
MKILVTAGNTQAPIDRVRSITNVFTGRTGAQIASRAFERGHSVALLTSHPEALDAILSVRERMAPDWRIRTYRTFDELDAALGEELAAAPFDAAIHAAAVGDYFSAGAFALAPGTSFDSELLRWQAESDAPRMLDASLGKVKSSHRELWLRLLPTPKLVDKIKSVWQFRGILVKFKLEVGLSIEELLEVAERARLHSRADLMVANTLEGMHDWAVVGNAESGYLNVPRAELANHLLDSIEALQRRRPSA